ncbi:MAG: potassium-transporting ATPase subunit C [Acidimicrobiaceae bacterium]|nr:potassium-transporting ATPase subunit C [Acidimicrobiaceae bacterium]
MLVHLRRAILVSLVFFVILGLAYPLVETGIGQAFFHHAANGSLTANGSTRVGQKWTGPQWFQGRPDGFDPMATGGSNLGPRSKVLVNTVAKQVAQLKKEGIMPTPGLVTSSGSGIDPGISPVDAYAQVDAVAAANHLPAAAVRHLVDTHITGREYGFLGSPFVNVLSLNEALAKLQ